MLDDCLNSGPICVGTYLRRKHARNGSYQFYLFNEFFTIPKDVAVSWKLRSQAEIHVQWQCCLGRYLYVFAPMAQENDDGKRDGIRALTIIDEVEHERWMVRSTSEAELLANIPREKLGKRLRRGA